MDETVLGHHKAKPSSQVCFLCGLKYHPKGKWSISLKRFRFDFKLILPKFRACSYTKDLDHVCKECEAVLRKQKDPFTYIVRDFRKRYETVD